MSKKNDILKNNMCDKLERVSRILIDGLFDEIIVFGDDRGYADKWSKGVPEVALDNSRNSSIS